MDVVIAGAGSIGLLLGSFLAEAGMDVTFYVRREEQAKVIRGEGIQRINQDGTISIFHAKSTTDITKISRTALIIVAVKFTGLRDLLLEIKNAGLINPLLFVQNGIGHFEIVKNFRSLEIAFATVEQGARRIDNRTVSHNGIGMLTIATLYSDDNVFDLIGQAHSDIFPVSYHTDAELILMRKVLINCMINPLTAILKVENGDLLSNVHCQTLFNTLYKELMCAFPEMQSVLSYEEIVEVCKKTAKNKSSMLADRMSGNPMEIDTIVTATIRKASGQAKSLPLLSALEQMLYAIDREGEKSWME